MPIIIIACSHTFSINRSFVRSLHESFLSSLIVVRVSMSREWKGLVKIGRKRAGYTAVTHASWVV